MANNRPNENRSNANRPRPRRRKSGVPVLLVIVLLIMALLMGGLGGFILARRTDTHVHALQEANDRITELENTLTLIGYPLGDDVSPQQWLYDNNAGANALAELNGATGEALEDELWSDESLLDATLPENADPVVVAEFEGGQLLSSEVIPEYNDQLTTQIFAGHSADEVAEETLNRVLREQAGDKIIAARAAEMGLTELTEEDLSQISREAAENYETQLDDYIAFAGESGESREDAAKRFEAESGVTLESITEALKKSRWSQKYFDTIVKDVTVTDEEVQAYYDDLLTRQKAEFQAYPEDFEYAHLTGELIVYRPAGYRAVRDILIAFDDEGESEATRLTEQVELGEADADLRSQLDALYAPLEKKAEEAQKKLAEGTAFTDLMDEFGCDPILKNEPLRSEGYYINENSFVNSVEYVEGSMMLEQPGQVSTPLRSLSGVHLAEYIGDVTPGEVPLADVLGDVRAQALKQKQTEYYNQQREALIEAAQVKFYPERMR